MKTTFELQPKTKHLETESKAILEMLSTLPNIWNAFVDTENMSVSFEYMNMTDLETFRRELHQMGYTIINDTHQLDNRRSPF